MKKPAVVHDLKPDRPDLTPPLPGVMMLLPVAFYLSAIGALGLGVFFTLKTKQAQKGEAVHIAAEKDVATAMERLKAEQTEIEAEQAKAKEVQTWIGTTQPFMPIVVAVINSVRDNNSLSAVRLARVPENPEHVDMKLLINSGGTAQVDETRGALAKEGYQAFREDTKSSERNSLGDVSYSAIFVKTGQN